MVHASCVPSKKSLLTSRLQRLPPMFSSRCLIILASMFQSMVNFELICVCTAWMEILKGIAIRIKKYIVKIIK